MDGKLTTENAKERRKRKLRTDYPHGVEGVEDARGSKSVTPDAASLCLVAGPIADEDESSKNVARPRRAKNKKGEEKLSRTLSDN